MFVLFAMYKLPSYVIKFISCSRSDEIMHSSSCDKLKSSAVYTTMPIFSRICKRRKIKLINVDLRVINIQLEVEEGELNDDFYDVWLINENSKLIDFYR